jgi:hypothetical protein
MEKFTRNQNSRITNDYAVSSCFLSYIRIGVEVRFIFVYNKLLNLGKSGYENRKNKMGTDRLR